ncbi:MAG: antitermination protein NusG, partial [Planctomycetota bacterium]
MPILKKETDIFPANLLEDAGLLGDQTRKWWSLYTLSRHEKELMRKLQARKLPFYGPIIPKRYRSAGGRMRTSYIPLFP